MTEGEQLLAQPVSAGVGLVGAQPYLRAQRRPRRAGSIRAA
ncbi:hypothetical protein ACFQ0B_46280 [Nonomuraea thailandensis]